MIAFLLSLAVLITLVGIVAVFIYRLLGDIFQFLLQLSELHKGIVEASQTWSQTMSQTIAGILAPQEQAIQEILPESADYLTPVENPFSFLPDPTPHYEDYPPLPVTETQDQPHDPLQNYGDPSTLPPELARQLGWDKLYREPTVEDILREQLNNG